MPNVPVNRLDADADCLNKVSISFGENIQKGEKLKQKSLIRSFAGGSH